VRQTRRRAATYRQEVSARILGTVGRIFTDKVGAVMICRPALRCAVLLVWCASLTLGDVSAVRACVRAFMRVRAACAVLFAVLCCTRVCDVCAAAQSALRALESQLITAYHYQTQSM
jgi:hypothetical protein